jgi:hypothetical protein
VYNDKDLTVYESLPCFVTVTKEKHLLILSESIDMQHLFLALFWTHLILINVNLVQQDATIQDKRKKNLLRLEIAILCECESEKP